MTLRDFWRFHFLKALVALVAVQLIIVAIIQNYNHKPQAFRDEVEMVQDRTLKIKPMLNDADKDEFDEIAILSIEQPLNGSAELKGKAIIYKPRLGFVGEDSLIYIISDGKKESKPTYIHMLVNKNLAPLANADYCMVYAGQKITIASLANDEDREDDSIFIESFSPPLHGKVLLESGQLTYFAGDKARLDSFSYVLSDGKSTALPASVVIDVKGKTEACYPWNYGDIGNVEIPGTVICEKGQTIIEASGSDIWDSRDGMYYVYQTMSGDGDIVCKVESFEAGYEWAKAGLMFRESLAGDAANFYAGVSMEHGVSVQSRINSGEGTNGLGGKEELEAPCWLKLTRKADLFMAFCSSDGQNWEQVGELELELPKSIYVGMCVTSHDNSEMGKAVFSNVLVAN